MFQFLEIIFATTFFRKLSKGATNIIILVQLLFRLIWVYASLNFLLFLKRSSLTYNTSARHESDTRAKRERHERRECDTSDTSATRVTLERHEYDTSAARTTRVRHVWKTFDFDNDTSKNIFSHLYIYYMASERLQADEQLHSKNYILVMSRSHAKMR